MQIKPPVSGVIYDFQKYYNQKQEQIRATQILMPEEIPQYSDSAVPFDLVKAYNGNIFANNRLKQISDFFKEAGMELTPEQIRQVLDRYYADFPYMKDVPTKAKGLYKEFVDTIKKTDLSQVDKIQSLIDYGARNDFERLQCELMNIEPDKMISANGFNIICGIIRDYVDLINEKTDYKINLSENEDGTILQVEAKKDGARMCFEPKNFYEIVRKKRPYGDNVIYLPAKDGDKYQYFYMTEEQVACKIDMDKKTVVGSLAVEDVSPKGLPECRLDVTMQSGIAYYGMAEYANTKGRGFDLEEESAFSLEQAALLIQTNPIAQAYYNDGCTPEFILSCVRNGELNENIIIGKDRFYEFIEEYASDDKTWDNEYLERLLDLIELEDNTYNDNALDVVASFALKEIETGEKYGDFMYEIASFVKYHNDARTVKTLLNLAQDFNLPLYETREIFEAVILCRANHQEDALAYLQNEVASKENPQEAFEKFKSYLKPYFE